MLAEHRQGAFAVVQTVAERDDINRRLRAIDERLFCEKQLGFDGKEVWCVVEDTGEQRGPDRFVCVYEYRDRDGEPIPYLTDNICVELEYRARTGTGNVLEARKIAEKRNADRLQRLREDTDQHYHDVAKDFEDHRKIGNFTIVPRSRQLQITRARVRSTQVEQRRAMASAFEIAQALEKNRRRATLTG